MTEAEVRAIVQDEIDKALRAAEIDGPHMERFRASPQVTITLDASGVREMIEREACAASVARERKRRGLGKPIRL